MAQIKFSDTKPELMGVIDLPGFREEFLSNSAVLDANQYRQQWGAAIEAINKGEDRVLVTSWGPRPGSEAISGRGYVFYWVGPDEVAIQETLLVNKFFFDDPERPSLDAIKVPEREVEVDGEAVSEWTATRHDIHELAESLR